MYLRTELVSLLGEAPRLTNARPTPTWRPEHGSREKSKHCKDRQRRDVDAAQRFPRTLKLNSQCSRRAEGGTESFHACTICRPRRRSTYEIQIRRAGGRDASTRSLGIGRPPRALQAPRPLRSCIAGRLLPQTPTTPSVVLQVRWSHRHLRRQNLPSRWGPGSYVDGLGHR